jgi:hypothetical protein
MDTKIILIQIIGLIACIIGISSFLYKNDKTLKKLMSLAAFLFSIHYFLLESWTSGIIKLINSSRNIISIKYSSKYILFIFLSLYWCLGLFYADKFIDYISVLTITISTIAMFTFSDIKLRLFFFPSIITWIIIGLQTNSIGGVIAESFVFISNSITIFKLYFTNKKSIKNV